MRRPRDPRHHQYHSQAFGYDMRACILAAIDSLLVEMGKDGVMVTEGTIGVSFSDGQAVSWFDEDEQ